MVVRRREQVVLLTALVLLNAVLVWQAYRLWRNFAKRTQWVYASVTPTPQPESGVVPSHLPLEGNFAEVIERNPFDPERGRVQVAEPARQPDPPYLYGTMNLGSRPLALMAAADSAGGGRWKRVFEGDEIGGYRVVSIAGSQVVLEWEGKRLVLDASDIATRPSARHDAGATAPALPAAAPTMGTGRPSPVTTVAPTATRGGEAQSRFSPGGFNAPPGAPVGAPHGTVFGGKRKVVEPTPFGTREYWVEVEKPPPPEKNQ